MTETLIPLIFAQSKSTLDWGDYLWAYKHQMLTWKDLIQAAIERVKSGSTNEQELELSNVNKESIWKASELVEMLAAWAYENREENPDPLGAVEVIYADFDYPSTIESFVRYLPPSDGYNPSQFSPEQNHKRLMAKWSEFLSQNSKDSK
jgi:hypothetical protein